MSREPNHHRPRGTSPSVSPHLDAASGALLAAPADLAASDDRLAEQPGGLAALGRRQFLEAAGFTLSLAAVAGCSRAPVEHALPAPYLPVGAVPGQPRHYASTCASCAAGCGLLISTRDGRPLKMEGLPDHPLSQGGLCAVGQAQPIGLYDSQRLPGPLRSGKPADWQSIDQEILDALDQVQVQHKAVRFVSSTITSPTLAAQIEAFLARFPDSRHVVVDAQNCAAILDAHVQTHSARVLPHYRFDRAAVIVSLDADFLGTWISPVEFTRAWSARRTPQADEPRMSYHVQFESRVSLTGANADMRYAVAPQSIGLLVNRLSQLIEAEQEASLRIDHTPLADQALERALQSLGPLLWQHRGECLIVCGSQDVNVQAWVNALNHRLGNYGATLDLERPSRQRQGSDADLALLLDELAGDEIGALLVADVDLLHLFAGRPDLAEAVDRVPLSISFAPHVDDFASHARFVCPDHHALEAWLDAEPVAGLVTLGQPTLRPLAQTRALLESLAVWSGQPTTALAAIQDYWQQSIFPGRTDGSQVFAEFWDNALRRGFVETVTDPPPEYGFNTAGLLPLEALEESSAFTAVLYHKVGMPDGRSAHNPWLHELPDPTTKVSWGNYACLAPDDAQRLGVVNGQVLLVSGGVPGLELELPALVQQGQYPGTVAIALNYGVRGTNRFQQIGPHWIGAQPTVSATGRVGVNAAPLLEFRHGTLRDTRSPISLAKTGKHRALAVSQRYHSLELPAEVAPRGAAERAIVQRTTLADFAQDPHSGAAHHHGSDSPQLWPEDHPTTGHAWRMVIDLNKCTGCSACVVACQSENNIPVVGYDEVLRQRDMHWLRIDRYYSGDGDDLQVDHQPMLCQHCGNAPCETVCPVLATVHSSEGLNEQVYNRCVGTRYCANNCPYKARRFNWFAYTHDDARQNLALNPEVTVRARGVMEKCSLCVQRIESGKIAARSQDQPLADGAVQTACQQSCPARAIEFGDLNDPHSAVRLAWENPRQYRVLEELNVRPSVAYLRVVTNRQQEPHRA